MANDEIGGRPVTISKEDGKVKVIFHPMASGAKHPDARMFQVTLGKADIDKLKKALWSHKRTIGNNKRTTLFIILTLLDIRG